MNVIWILVWTVVGGLQKVGVLKMARLHLVIGKRCRRSAVQNIISARAVK